MSETVEHAGNKVSALNRYANLPSPVRQHSHINTDTIHIRSSHCIPLDGRTLPQSLAFLFIKAETLIPSKRFPFRMPH